MTYIIDFYNGNSYIFNNVEFILNIATNKVIKIYFKNNKIRNIPKGSIRKYYIVK